MFKVKKVAAGSNERKIGAWLGGSILGSLGSFHEMCVICIYMCIHVALCMFVAVL